MRSRVDWYHYFADDDEATTHGRNTGQRKMLILMEPGSKTESEKETQTFMVQDLESFIFPTAPPLPSDTKLRLGDIDCFIM